MTKKFLQSIRKNRKGSRKMIKGLNYQFIKMKMQKYIHPQENANQLSDDLS